MLKFAASAPKERSVILRMPALQADAFHLTHPWTGRDLFLFGHLTAAMTTFLALSKERFRYRDGFPGIHSVNPKVIGRQKVSSLHETVEVMLSVLANLLAVA